MKSVFIAGTDTGIGKTVVTGCLAGHLLKKGHNAITQKWIQTGCDCHSSSDIAAHLKIMGLNAAAIKNYFPYMEPYMFRPACSPHLACKIEKKRIDVDKIINSFNFLSGRFDIVIAEGIGGALVPFSGKRLVIDIVKELNLPVVIVAGNKLGAINHTLLTIEALMARRIRILGIVFNNIKKENNDILDDNPCIIRRLTGQEIFGILPWEPGHDRLRDRFAPIAERISKLL